MSRSPARPRPTRGRVGRSRCAARELGAARSSSASSARPATSSTSPSTRSCSSALDLHYTLRRSARSSSRSTNNYRWNRLWTFRDERGACRRSRALRFFVVSSARARREPRAFSTLLVERGLGEVVAQAIAIVARHAGELRRQQALVVPAAVSRLRPRVSSAPPSSALALAVRGGAARSAPSTHGGSAAPRPPSPRELGRRAARASEATRGVPRGSRRSPRWLDRYPPTPTTDGDVRRARAAGPVQGLVGRGRADRAGGASTTARGVVREAWTGPQVAWKMARGRPGAFGGRTLTSGRSGSASRRVFFLGLADLRRLARGAQPRPARAALVRGLARVLRPRRGLRRAFRSPYPPLVYLARAHAVDRVRVGGRARRAAVARLAGLGARRRDPLPRRLPRRAQRPDRARRDRRRLRGRDRRRTGSSTARRRTGTCRSARALQPCGPADANGEVRDRIQTNGRCESANPRGDTYGPGRLPRLRPRGGRLRLEREVGRAAGGARDVDRVRPARRSSASCSSGCRFGGTPARRDARVRVGRVPVHRVRADCEHERRDHAGAARLGLLARDVAVGARRRRVALAGWTKFAALAARRRCG